MKAAAVVANEDVQYQEVEEPQAKPGWVKIKVKASGICGSDVPRVLNHGVHFYPIVLGHESRRPCIRCTSSSLYEM